ncbi:putative hydrolase or acyltransferase of alpha/beta superfamily [Rhizobium leguminosarum bv. trifolii WSM2297]|uniref:Putative hydrolase or acyltransferase of alpha/beta superfamily n=1 Tax=Rhizobium leguminosarum bv. trifolii WSM2297 TaxID=754762 RepID=J0CAV8_RHILT|nr:epoxide hydrolase family protein [Rhizobium leguminosarum]EJC80227.1 putative hydrolase or acyltransferase of alpha/beta superfamily [Rhizobium leguminosarum bv. trifolii WSM2297]
MSQTQPAITRRTLLALAASASAVGILPNAATATSATPGITPFKYTATDEQLADLHRRVVAARLPDEENVADDSQGVRLGTIKKLAKHWKSHDWRKIETRLNSFPQFITDIDGLDIHFIHVKSKHENALPIVITHGWPGSVIEQLKIIKPLTDPTAFSGTEADAFHVVIPSLPGYGFSGKPRETGWNPPRIAKAWAVLMERLGYTKYVAQGGDWGNAVTELMAVQEPQGLIGIHTNMAATVPADIAKLLSSGAPAPADLSADEKGAYEQLDDFYKNGLGYAIEMNNRPQTLYGIVDSPIGLASWMLDHDIRSYRMIARSIDGEKEGLTPDDVLDNITLYWLTNTAISSARLYWDNAHHPSGGFFDPRGIKIPVAVSAFPDEIYQAPQSWAEKAYPNLIHYNRLPKGGHFAAWEQPELFTAELRASFKSLRDQI